MEFSKVQFIVFGGYYNDNEEEWDVIQQHTDETYELYLDGLESCGTMDDDDIYEGVAFENNKAFAQVDRKGKIEYIELDIEKFIKK